MLVSPLLWLVNVGLASAYYQPIRPAEFLTQCQDLSQIKAELTCSKGHCTKAGAAAGLEVYALQRLQCSRDAECRSSATQMECHRGTCTCPPYFAFNITSCRCERSEVCGEEDDKPCYSHNNRKCEDKFCTCSKAGPNFSQMLLDPEFLFCVLPLKHKITTDGLGPGLILLCVLGALVTAVLLTVLAVHLYRNCVCEKGDYKCETDGAAVAEPQVHNATWDYPSLDYIPKDEEIVFTLAQAKDMVGASNASTIHVTDEGNVVMHTSFDHDNLAYIEDDVDHKNDVNHNS